MCYEFVSIFTTYKQLKVIVTVIVTGNMKCNCNLIVTDINVIDPCLVTITLGICPHSRLGTLSWPVTHVDGHNNDGQVFLGGRCH